MCGIVGQLSFSSPIDPVRFDAMRDTLIHRGPDGYGTKRLADGRVALGHRRLSILDLSERGHQPMCNEDQTVWITFNGEIYNFVSLRQQLIRAGHRFISSCDTEVLVHGYEEWGTDGLLERLKGMFAFGIWDQTLGKLTVARDRFGIKPVFFYQDDRQFIFASELKAITRDPTVPRQLRQDALADYFIYSYVPHPDTVWEGINRLRPAHYLELELRTGTQSVTRYWSLQPGMRRISQEEAVGRTDELLCQAVTQHLVSDVPVGLFLSGGYDSSAVLMYAREAAADVASFSLGFAGSARSEHEPAGKIAASLGSPHNVRLLGAEDDIFPLVERLVAHYDEPFAVSSQLTYHYVAELAARTHKVVLGGDGGDEVFAGYTWYRSLRHQRRRPRNWARAFLGRRSLREQTIDHYAQQQTGVYYYLRHLDLLAPDLERRMQARKFTYFHSHLDADRGLVKSVQQLDVDTFMLDNCLQRADMSSMLHSLEVRVPFLDHELLEWVYSLHPNVYFDPRHNKKLLYHNLARKISPEILARKKQGFGFQHRDSLKAPRYLDFINNGELRRQGIITRPVDSSTINGEIAFHLLFLEQWLRTN